MNFPKKQHFPVGLELRTKITSLIAKSTSLRLSDTTFFARWLQLKCFFLGALSYQASTVALLSCKEMFNFSVEDYQELTKREENDLEYMISQTENAISNIEAFTEQLSRDLSVLDGVIELTKLILSN